MNIKQIDIQVIPIHEMRYKTVGDYWWNEDKTILAIRVADSGNTIYNESVALHELVEALLCEHRGISEESISSFDIEFEKLNTGREAGFEPDAPYTKEHYFATAIEMLYGQQLNISLNDYDDCITALHESFAE